MGHSCRICRRIRANEKFSRKGHKNHICKDCTKKPKEERDAIDQTNEIFGYLKQSNISKKNLSRLEELSHSTNDHIALLASVALKVGRVKPHKRRRLKFLAKEHRDLLEQLKETGLITAHHW